MNPNFNQAAHDALCNHDRAMEYMAEYDQTGERSILMMAIHYEEKAADYWRDKRDKEPTRGIVFSSLASICQQAGLPGYAYDTAKRGLDGSPQSPYAEKLIEIRDWAREIIIADIPKQEQTNVN